MSRDEAWEAKNSPGVGSGEGCGCAQVLGPEGRHPWVLREAALGNLGKVTVIGEVSEAWKRANVTPSPMKEVLGSLKVPEELILGTISTPKGHAGDGSSQRGLTEGRRAWPAFNEVTGPVVEGQAMGVLFRC